tara:strand:- start:1126 stop:1455 length:330 start_codon:yes stop_codon:yes gene_type:complete
MQIIGKLTTKLDRETGTSKSGKSWEKQSIVIEQAGTEYNKEVVVSFFGDKIKSLRDIHEGSEVNVSINLSSREYNGKYYHNIDGWFIAKVGEETVGNNFVTADDDNLPF